MDFRQALMISAAGIAQSALPLYRLAEIVANRDRILEGPDGDDTDVPTIDPVETRRIQDANLQMLEASRATLMRTIAMLR